MDQIEQRIFIVGCPRSGTTLVQSLLAAHSRITSFPESHCLRGLSQGFPLWQNFFGSMGLIPPSNLIRIKKFLQDIDQDVLLPSLPSFVIRKSQYTHAFIKVLDTVTCAEDKDIWIEKTPGHLHHIDYIQKVVRSAKFIHVIRNGHSVVASLHEVTHRYPEAWNGARDIDTCINRWLNDINISLSYLNHTNHFLVRYEELVGNLEPTLHRLCDFIGVNFEANMLEAYQSVAARVTLQGEAWKIDNREKIKNSNVSKFHERFGAAEQDYILQKVAGLNAMLEHLLPLSNQPLQTLRQV